MPNHQAMLQEAGALLQGHFVLASGRHSEWYVNKTAAFVFSSHARAHAAAIAFQFRQLHVEAVVAPELGAVTFAARVTDELSKQTGIDVINVVAEKDRNNVGKFKIGRDQARFLKGKRVLVIEDVFTTGASVIETIAATREAGGTVIGAGVLWNRDRFNVTADSLGVPELYAVIDEFIPSYDADECPLCDNKHPISTNVGKGKEFLASLNQKSGEL